METIIDYLLLATLLGVTWASIDEFTWNDCDPDPNRAVKIYNVAVSPMPVVLPGPVTISVNASIDKVIEGGQLKFDLTRHVTILGDKHVPCILGLGSCNVNFCTILDDMARSDAKRQTISTEVTKLLNTNQIDVTCPIQPQALVVSQYTMNLPNIGGLGTVLVEGDYTVKVSLRNKHNAHIGCLAFKAEFLQKSGFLFG